MRESRTNFDFSKHVLNITKTDLITIHELKDPKYDYMYSLKFINTNGVMVVTGDFGNWMFCREFLPSEKTGVSDMYWVEKLQLYSSQKALGYSSEETAKQLEYEIKQGLEEYGYDGDRLKKAKEFYKELLENVDDEIEYTYKAYRNYDCPSFLDMEEIPFVKSIRHQLKIVFDAFDELCRRCKTEKTIEHVDN